MTQQTDKRAVGEGRRRMSGHAAVSALAEPEPICRGAICQLKLYIGDGEISFSTSTMQFGA
jgi:hypothetical protein